MSCLQGNVAQEIDVYQKTILKNDKMIKFLVYIVKRDSMKTAVGVMQQINTRVNISQ